MRLTAVLMGVMLAGIAVDAQAQQGLPSQAMLADMGLSGMQILSDDEAMAIRGSGFSWTGVGTAHHFHHSIHKFHKWVDKFHEWVRHFQKHTQQFHHDFGQPHQVVKKHDGVHVHHFSFKKLSFKNFPKHRPLKRW